MAQGEGRYPEREQHDEHNSGPETRRCGGNGDGHECEITQTVKPSHPQRWQRGTPAPRLLAAYSHIQHTPWGYISTGARPSDEVSVTDSAKEDEHGTL
ncbi:hypothetical protein GCM10009642_17830 [Nocardiopsis metallicus]